MSHCYVKNCILLIIITNETLLVICIIYFPGGPIIATSNGLKGRGWSKPGVCHISVNNQWIFTKFSAVVHYVMSHQIINFQLICIIYAWISHNSKVPNEEHYSEKTNYSKHMFSSVTCSLHSRGCNSYFEIC